MSSVSSATSNSMSFNKVIKDFKKTLTERKTPKNLIYLNRIMLVIFLITITLSGIDFGIVSSTVNILNRQSQRTLITEKRNLGLI
jgi:predicted histidine transporter YuiF (NhaC family)